MAHNILPISSKTKIQFHFHFFHPSFYLVRSWCRSYIKGTDGLLVGLRQLCSALKTLKPKWDLLSLWVARSLRKCNFYMLILGWTHKRLCEGKLFVFFSANVFCCYEITRLNFEIVSEIPSCRPNSINFWIEQNFHPTRSMTPFHTYSYFPMTKSPISPIIPNWIENFQHTFWQNIASCFWSP